MYGNVFSAWEWVYCLELCLVPGSVFSTCMGVCLVHGSTFSAWEFV